MKFIGSILILSWFSVTTFSISSSVLRRSTKAAVRPFFQQQRRSMAAVFSLPFKVKEREVGQILLDERTWFEKGTIPKPPEGEQNPNSLVISERNPIEAKVVPFFTASFLGLRSSFEGEYGRNRVQVVYMPMTTCTGNGTAITTMQATPMIVTDWYNCHGDLTSTDYPIGIKDTQVYAGLKHQRKLVEDSLRTSDLSELQLRKIPEDVIIDPREVKFIRMFEMIIRVITNFEEERARNFIREHWKADHSRVKNITVHFNQAMIETLNFYLPAYFYNYQTEDDEALYKIINASSGSLKGECLYDPKKVALVSGLFSLACAGIYTASNPVVGLDALALQVIAPSIAASGFLGLITDLLNSIKTYKRIFALQQEIKSNGKYESTVEDEEAQRFNQQVREEAIKKSKGNDPYLLLDIQAHETPLTEELLKDKYLQQMRKWHPDVFDGDEKLANEVATKLSEAFSKLHKKISSPNK